MANTENITPIKKSVADETQEQIRAIASRASESDRSRLKKLKDEAMGSAYRTNMVEVTPGMAALIVCDDNSHNRTWSALWSIELARRMKTGQWKQNNQGVGLYNTGELEDGQHRLTAQALANLTWTWPVVFGIAKDAIDTVDGGKRRSGADHAGQDGILQASLKQTIVKNAANYLVKFGDRTAALKSEAEVKAAIEKNNDLLDTCIEIGKASRENIAQPQLKENAAASITYLMMSCGWSEQRIREKLALFQTGISMQGDNEPYFVAAKVLEQRRKKSANKEKLTIMKEMGIVVHALVETEKGAKAIQEKNIKAAVDGKASFPDPHYPTEAAQKAA